MAQAAANGSAALGGSQYGYIQCKNPACQYRFQGRWNGVCPIVGCTCVEFEFIELNGHRRAMQCGTCEYVFLSPVLQTGLRLRQKIACPCPILGCTGMELICVAGEAQFASR